MTHHPVLLCEAILGLAIKADGIYVDGTFGRGGHSRAILDQLNDHGRLLAVDKDLSAVEYAKKNFMHDPRFQIIHGTFADLSSIARDTGVFGSINGILLDLGVSSPQLDSPERGFSFMREGPLDMRMDVSQKLDAAKFIATATQDEMRDIFQNYGEERYATRIARAIVLARAQAPILTTAKLAEIVKAAHPKWEKHKHPATRVFQAIRIHINEELNSLTSCLTQAVESLAIGGRLAVISFHSLEDRRVKQFMRAETHGIQPPIGVPIKAVDIQASWKIVGKAIKPSEQERTDNMRARSAVLRIGEKIA